LLFTQAELAGSPRLFARSALQLSGKSTLRGEFAMDTPSQELCNPLARFSIENRSQLPAPSARSAVAVILLSLLSSFAHGGPTPETRTSMPL
jgi:hypothetical protein